MNEEEMSPVFFSNLVFENEFSSHESRPGLPPTLDDGMPQQLGCLIRTGIQLHHWDANTAAQHFILPLKQKPAQLLCMH